MQATVKITFSEYKGKQYKYPVKINTPINPSDIALQISKQILEIQIKRRKVKRVSGKKELSPAYNLLLKKLPKALDDIGLEYNMPEKVQTKDQAFMVCEQFNKKIIAKKLLDGKFQITKYRVGKSFNLQLAVDIDNQDINNALNLKTHCELLFDYDFELNKSIRNGEVKSYHLIGTKIYNNEREWLYDNCRILKSDLRLEDLNNYLKSLDEFDVSIKNKNIDLTKAFKESGLYNTEWNFDIPFTLISIRRRKHTIRISKKGIDDRYE